jgi:hypothetical protein
MRFTHFLSVLIIFFSVSVSASPTAQFPLDDNAEDVSGSELHGTRTGGTATEDRSGISAGAINFDGVGDYIDVPQLLFTGDGSVSFWARSAGEQNRFAVPISQGHWGSPVTTGFAFQYGFPASNAISLIWGNGVGVHRWRSLSFGVNLEADLNWHHFAFSKTGSTISIYLDGEAVGQSSIGMDFGHYNFNIGRDSYNTDNNNRAFNGTIDDVQVFDQGLTSDEIIALFVGVQDADEDGIIDENDQCPNSLDVVDPSGCTISQICPCDAAFKNHGQRMSCTSRTAEAFVQAALITEEEADVVISTTAKNKCNKGRAKPRGR